MGIFDNAESVFVGDKEVASIKIGENTLYEKEEESVLTAVVQRSSNNITKLGYPYSTSNQWIIFQEGATPEVDWGDGTISAVDTHTHASHEYTDELEVHTITLKNVVRLEYYTFHGRFDSSPSYDCDLLSINIPNSVTKIGSSCFANCNHLTEINLPNSISTLSDYCFGDTGITSFVVPPLVTVVPARMVNGCSDLESVTLHEGITEIGNSAFWGCSKLENLNIPSSVNSIKVGAFKDVKGDIIFNWTSANDIVPYGSDWGDDFTIIVPDGTTSLYTAKGYPSENIVEY